MGIGGRSPVVIGMGNEFGHEPQTGRVVGVFLKIYPECIDAGAFPVDKAVPGRQDDPGMDQSAGAHLVGSEVRVIGHHGPDAGVFTIWLAPGYSQDPVEIANEFESEIIKLLIAE